MIMSRTDRRDDTDSIELEILRSESMEAAKIVGYKSIDFCGLPDNRMDSLDLLDVIKLVSGSSRSIYRIQYLHTIMEI